MLFGAGWGGMADGIFGAGMANMSDRRFGAGRIDVAGRLTLNPLPHIDPWMSILFPALLWFGSGGSFTFGGAKPVPVESG